MGKLLKIGIVGCGAIGSSLAKSVAWDFRRSAKLVALYDIDEAKAQRLARSFAPKARVKDLASLIRKSDLVIECAHADHSFAIARLTLAAGKDSMVMSVGGVVSRIARLAKLARANSARLYIPSGAISGVDALKAANLGKVKKVVLTTRKNPISFKGVKFVEEQRIDLETMDKDTTLFSGSARQAMKSFPQNVNVAGILSLAGIGQDKTRVTIIASPKTKKNIHEIEIEAEAGTVFTRTENILHPDNPKTSFLAVLSAIATLKQIVEPVRVGT